MMHFCDLCDECGTKRFAGGAEEDCAACRLVKPTPTMRRVFFNDTTNQIIDCGATIVVDGKPEGNSCFYLSSARCMMPVFGSAALLSDATQLKKEILPLANEVARSRAHALNAPRKFDGSIMADENVCLAFCKLVAPLSVVSVAHGQLCVAVYASPVWADEVSVFFEPERQHYSALVEEA